MISLRETIVVEGKDDVSAVRKAADANVIATHGYGISEETIDLIRSAYEKTGIIIFTDPDHAGLSIREKLTSLFPEAKQAYLAPKQARKKGDLGIENATPQDIEAALLAVVSSVKKKEDTLRVTAEDLDRLGLTGKPDSARLREEVGALLGIGYANGKTFLRRLETMGITPAALEKAAERVYNEEKAEN